LLAAFAAIAAMSFSALSVACSRPNHLNVELQIHVKMMTSHYAGYILYEALGINNLLPNIQKQLDIDIIVSV